jgi:DNA-3-methyladenine glycosylase
VSVPEDSGPTVPRPSEVAEDDAATAEPAGDITVDGAGQGVGREQAAAESAEPGVLPPGRIVPASFFARPSDEVARDLIGKIVWARSAGGGRLTEVEAYLPEGDPACHAYRGPTRRNAAMFGPPGSIYIFRSYGIHLLLNFVCEREGVGSAVLVRSFEPLESPAGSVSELAEVSETPGPPQRAPQQAPPGAHTRAACGPGLVGQALRLHPGLNGLPLGDASGLYVLDDGHQPEVQVTTRVGISKGQHFQLRYYMKDSKCVTRPVRNAGRD